MTPIVMVESRPTWMTHTTPKGKVKIPSATDHTIGTVRRRLTHATIGARSLRVGQRLLVVVHCFGTSLTRETIGSRRGFTWEVLTAVLSCVAIVVGRTTKAVGTDAIVLIFRKIISAIHAIKIARVLGDKPTEFVPATKRSWTVIVVGFGDGHGNDSVW